MKNVLCKLHNTFFIQWCDVIVNNFKHLNFQHLPNGMIIGNYVR